MTTAPSNLLKSDGIWSTASHNKTTLAHGIASIATHRLADGDKIRRTFFGPEDVKMEFLVPSGTAPGETDLGPVKYLDIVVPDAPVLKDGAWQYTQTPGGRYTNCFVFRVKWKPEHIGSGVYDMGTEDGVTLFEDWFL